MQSDQLQYCSVQDQRLGTPEQTAMSLRAWWQAATSLEAYQGYTQGCGVRLLRCVCAVFFLKLTTYVCMLTLQLAEQKAKQRTAHRCEQHIVASIRL